MAKTQRSFGRLILQIALGVMLAVGGIWALTGAGDFGCKAITSIFSGDVARLLKIVFGVIELLAGIFLVLELFLGDVFGKLDNILMIIIWIVWIVAIIFGDIIKGDFNPFIEWLYGFASHLIILGAMISLND